MHWVETLHSLHSWKTWFCLWEPDFPGVFFQISNTIFLVWEYFSESWNKMKWGTFCLFVPVKESRKNATSGTVFLQFNYFRQKYLAVMAATADEGRQVPLTKSCKMQKNYTGQRVQKGAKDWTFYQIFYILSQWLQWSMKAGRKVSLGVPLSPAASLVGDIGDVQQMTKNLSTRIPNSSLKYTLKETCIWEIFRMNFYFQDRLIACQTL